MAHYYEIEVETSSGVTNAAAATLVTLLSWQSFQITYRRRAPGSITITIPQDGTHHLSEFVSGRQLYVKRDGGYWWAGIINAAYLPNGEKPGPIVLEGWNNAYTLLFSRNSCRLGFGGVEYAGFDADGVITNVLDEAEHYSGTDWFPSAQRTIGAAAAGTLARFLSTNQSPLELNTEMADIEGWSWRVGVNSSGVFTFKVGTSAVQDLTSTVQVFTPYGPPDAPITHLSGHRRDGSRIVSDVLVVQRTPQINTTLNGIHAATATSITVQSNGTYRMEAGDILVFSDGTPTLREEKVISTVNSTTNVTITAGRTNTHPDKATVRTVTDMRSRNTTVNGATAVEEQHHAQWVVIWNDKLDGTVRRTQIGEAYLAAYDHPLETATLVTTDGILIDTWQDAGCEPGDSIKVTSSHPELSLIYDNTTVVVQEQTFTYSIKDGPTLTAQLGDPQLDQLDELTRRTAGANAAATSVGA